MPSRIGGLRLAMAATVAMTLALSLAGLPARGDTVQSLSPVQATLAIQAPGTLVARGVAVDIDLEYRCLPGVRVYSVYVDVSERFGRDIAQGFAYVDGSELEPCLGLVPQYVTVRVYGYDKAFKPGTGLVRASLYGDDGFGGYFTVTDEREVKLAK
jgi:hypothetical protein